MHGIGSRRAATTGSWSTSATTVERLERSAEAWIPALREVPIAAIGPSTAGAVRAVGAEAALVPGEAVGESLVEAFPRGAGRVLVLRPEVARSVVPEGLRAKGWQVEEVAVYRTVPATLDADTRRRVRTADVVTFTSPSTVTSLVASIGADALPPVVATIGPVTSRACRAAGMDVAAEAEPHTIDGLLDAVRRAVAPR